MNFKIKIILSSLLFCSLLPAESLYSIDTPHGGDFEIKTTTSDKFKLSSLKGKTVFLFFGFTKCPHVCPLTMQRLKKLDSAITNLKKEDAHFLFISVDNERDSVESLKKYIEPFGARFSAGVGSDDQLRNIMSLFGARFSKIKNPDGSLFVSHTDNVFVIDQSGKWTQTVAFNADYEAYLKAYLNSQKVIEQKEQMIASRKMKLLMQVKNCDLSQKTCTAKLPNQEKLSVTFSPHPIRTQIPIDIEVKISGDQMTPTEIDFVGVEQNMGLIRPQLIYNKNNYIAQTELPICELPKMSWKIRILLKDKAQKLSFVEFLLTTDR